MADTGEIKAIVLLLGGGAWLYVKGWMSVRRSWAIRNLPTAKARSVAMGMAELCGTVRLTATPGLSSPIRGVPCAWWRVQVLETRGSGKHRRTLTLLDVAVSTPFHLEDDTGRILVEPEGAEVWDDPHYDVSWGGFGGAPEPAITGFLASRGCGSSVFSDYRLREWAIRGDAQTYVLGEVALSGRGAAESRRVKLADRLRHRLRNPAMKAEIDTNRDGIIQTPEWDAARERAGLELAAEPDAGPPPPVVRKPGHGYFIISEGSESRALARQGWGAAKLAGGIAAIVGGVAWLIGWLTR